MLKIKETAIVNMCLDYLELKGYFAFRVNTMGNFNPKTNSYYANPRLKKGCPDILLIMPPNGKIIGIEVKSKDGKQSDNQKEFERMMKKNGADYWLIYSIDELIGKLL